MVGMENNVFGLNVTLLMANEWSKWHTVAAFTVTVA